MMFKGVSYRYGSDWDSAAPTTSRRESIKRIVDRSKGLLKVIWHENYCPFEGVVACGCDGHIKPIHRSLKEFILKQVVPSTPSAVVGSCDLAARYCAASLSILKISTVGNFTIQSVSAEAIRCAYTAMFTRSENEDNVLRILDELEGTCSALLEALGYSEPCMSLESNNFVYDCLPTEQLPTEEQRFWYASNASVSRSEKISAKIRVRAMALCSKYDLARREDPQRTTHQWTHCLGEPKIESPTFYRGDGQRSDSFIRYCGQGYPTSLNKIGRHATMDTGGTGLLTGLGNNTETQPAQVRGDQLNTTLPPLKTDAVCKGNSDDSDNMLWESFSSTDLSLNEAHPLMALKDGITEAVYRGFLEYRKKYTGGNR
ncbi:hypothetical protein NUW58_g2570 [Xylaria curta]|uniref:Uncharacterized protein n=1 Tax=Xylaria curta TaxID=42375 RepID=A0ACC1PGN2_9PEZI|nr:hypothetical protein NUW58_g2570 [Xylaria curta]